MPVSGGSAGCGIASAGCGAASAGRASTGDGSAPSDGLGVDLDTDLADLPNLPDLGAGFVELGAGFVGLGPATGFASAPSLVHSR